jgi:exosome complex component RRP4
VQSHCTRYTPEVGDVVVGRVAEVVDTRWRLDINGRQLASLQLSSVNLPGAHRRRTDEDALQMRSFLSEGHLVTAEVQKVMSDRSVSLHTRSAKYGPLAQGVLVSVPASLVRRTKLHFHTLEDLGVDMVIGVNGYIWLAPAPSEAEKERRRRLAEDDTLDRDQDRRAAASTGASIERAQQQQTGEGASADADGTESAGAAGEAEPVTLEVRESIARLRGAILALAQARRKLHRESILAVYNTSVQMNVTVSAMRDSRVAVAITQGVGLE